MFGSGLTHLPLLVSYPRSGTNWIRYFIESVSGQPTPGEFRCVGGRHFIIDRAHCASTAIAQHARVILTIRNYKECLVRQHGLTTIQRYREASDYLRDGAIAQPACWYSDNVIAFDQHAGPKLLLYYEDLVAQPQFELPRLGEFLSFADDDVQRFLRDIESHRARSVKAYTRYRHRSDTRGDETFDHHGRALSDADRAAFDDHFRSALGPKFAPYLGRYEESDATKNEDQAAPADAVDDRSQSGL